jgi:hypothetical protein
MLNRLHTEFKRYFSMAPSSPLPGNAIRSMFGSSRNRSALSEIIADRIFLCDLPGSAKFAEVTVPNQTEAALFVSCIDIIELAESKILLEPHAPNIKYHVLAMEDSTAVVGSIDHIYDTLKLMSAFADNKKPILIHCYSGVGRSAMMTAIHIAHRYLLDDAVVKDYIDGKLDPADKDFIKKLYRAATRLVSSERSCCQFNSSQREALAIEVLTELSRRKSSPSETEQRDDSYQFLVALTQSAEFKKLNYYFFNALPSDHYNATDISDAQKPVDPRTMIKPFFNDFLLNKDGWYQQLIDAASSEPPNDNNQNPLYIFCNSPFGLLDKNKNKTVQKRRELINGILNIITRLATQYPEALYSEQVAASLALSERSRVSNT